MKFDEIKSSGSYASCDLIEAKSKISQEMLRISKRGEVFDLPL